MTRVRFVMILAIVGGTALVAGIVKDGGRSPFHRLTASVLPGSSVRSPGELTGGKLHRGPFAGLAAAHDDGYERVFRGDVVGDTLERHRLAGGDRHDLEGAGLSGDRPVRPGTREGQDRRRLAGWSPRLSTLKALLLNSEGEAKRSYEVLQEVRSLVEGDDRLAGEYLYTIIYFQGVAAMRRGENENCIECRGESSCILPIAPAAVHTNPDRLAAGDPALHRVPRAVPRRPRGPLAAQPGPHDPGRVSRQGRSAVPDLAGSIPSSPSSTSASSATSATWSGVNRFNQAGGAIMEDFDNDGLLDLAVTSFDPTEPMAFYRNKGDGTFEDRTEAAGLTGQLGGLYCVQTDYNNDGRLDIFIPRGAWLPLPDPPEPAAEQRRRHLHRRHRGGRAARPGQFQLRALGRLRQRRLARPVHRLRDGSRTACITTGATAPSRRSPPRPACGQTGRRCSARVPPGSTTTTTTIPTCSSTT